MLCKLTNVTSSVLIKNKRAADHATSPNLRGMAAYRTHDKKMRAAMLNVISRGFNRELAVRPRIAEKEQRTHHYRSQLRGRDRWLEGQMKRIILYRRFKDIVLYTHNTRGEFTANWDKAGAATGAGIGEKNRFASDQIRLRLHCYGVSATSVPKYSIRRRCWHWHLGLKGFLINSSAILQAH